MEDTFLEPPEMTTDISVKEFSGMQTSSTIDVQEDEDRSRMYVLAGICIIVLGLVLLVLLFGFIFVGDGTKGSSAGTDDTDETTPVTWGVARIPVAARYTTQTTVGAPTGILAPTQGTPRPTAASQATAATSSTSSPQTRSTTWSSTKATTAPLTTMSTSQQPSFMTVVTTPTPPPQTTPLTTTPLTTTRLTTTRPTTTRPTTTRPTTTRPTTTRSTTTRTTTTRTTTTRTTTTHMTTPTTTSTTTITTSTPSTMPSTSSTIRTTTEDTFQLTADYSTPVYNDLHNFACFFNASKQGFGAFGRTYGIGYFPFQVCHILLYCCYGLADNMTFVPQNPTVDLPPRDALRRAAGFKQTNTWLWTYLVLEGSDTNFEKLMDNRSGEVHKFRDNAVNWLANYNYDGIRILWRNTPAGRNASIFHFSTLVAAELYRYKRSLGFFVPYEENLRRAYDVFALQHALLVPYTIMLYRASPLDLPTRAKWLTYEDVRFTTQQLNVTVRNMLCHMFSLQWHSFKVNDSLCTSTTLRTGKTSVLDWGQPGPLTRTRGRLSLYEVCDMTSGTAWTRGRLMGAAFACKDSEVLVGLDNNRASNWIRRDLHDPSNGICFGYMDPENDDFPGRCNANTPFPLIRGMFQHFVHGKAQSGGRTDNNLPLLADIPADFG